MKKNIIYIAVLLIVLLGVTIIYYQRNYFLEPKEIIASRKEEKVFNSAISMMYETSAGSGEYIETADSGWPSSGYKFNATLSKCDNGGTLTWDDTNKRVLMSSNTSDRCYVYFDKATIGSKCTGQNMASCIKENYQLDSSILLHNSSLTNGANDGSYRYTGASESVNNYVCFGSDAATCPTDNLYRIIGVFGSQVKLIKSEYASSALLGTDGNYYGSGNNYSWKSSDIDDMNNWETSILNNTNLNKNYINNIGSTWAEKIGTTKWKVGGNTSSNITQTTTPNTYKNEITNPAVAKTHNAKIGLMYASDYGFSTSQTNWTTNLVSYSESKITSENWMYMGENEWTITRSSLGSYMVYTINSSGSVVDDGSDFGYVVRPSFYLVSSAKLVSGSGSSVDPFRITLPDNMVRFSVNGDSYICNPNTTWESFVNTEYNNGVISINEYSNSLVYFNGLLECGIKNSSNTIETSDNIITNSTYTLTGCSGGSIG